jgi:hypothetical protein
MNQELDKAHGSLNQEKLLFKGEISKQEQTVKSLTQTNKILENNNFNQNLSIPPFTEINNELKQEIKELQNKN